MSFVSRGSPLFEEFLKMAGDMSSVVVTSSVPSVGPGDALLVIDMQNDFCPKDPIGNPDGGRFGVAEGDHIVPAITKLIDHFVDAGATVCATRDYHPHDHCCFTSVGGPFPAHCVQGSRGSYFLPPIGKALASGLARAGSDKVFVAFKAMHEDIDSFG